MQSDSLTTLQKLAQKIHAMEVSPAAADAVPLATGWHDLDDAIGGGLRRGALHEWIGPSCAGDNKHKSSASAWIAPRFLSAHLAWQALSQAPTSHGLPWIVWIGRRCWPHLWALVRRRVGEQSDHRLLQQSLLIDPPDDASRLWAIDLALRCAAVALVIADGSGLNLPATRRLQLAAEAKTSCALLLRPPHEQTHLSSAATRWLISHHPSATLAPCWRMELLRCKGMTRARGTWLLELNHDQGLVHLSADVVQRPAAKTSVRRTA